jgi:hypothetical protein
MHLLDFEPTGRVTPLSFSLASFPTAKLQRANDTQAFHLLSGHPSPRLNLNQNSGSVRWWNQKLRQAVHSFCFRRNHNSTSTQILLQSVANANSRPIACFTHPSRPDFHWPCLSLALSFTGSVLCLLCLLPNLSHFRVRFLLWS